MKTVKNLKTMSLAGGAALALSMASGAVLAADNNPFEMNELSSGYQVAMSIMPEGSCGGKGEEGKCGGSKVEEGKCGEGKCGGSKVEEGKCGEGKCGGSKPTE